MTALTLNEPTLLDALMFMHEHRDTLRFEVRDETLLIVRPSEAAARCADDIRRLKDHIRYLLAPANWNERLALRLVMLVHEKAGSIIRGRVVEVVEYAQAETGFWKEIEVCNAAIDQAAREEDWKTFAKEVCRYPSLYRRMLADYIAQAA